MIAHRTQAKNVVETGTDATVQAALQFLARQRHLTPQRWVCEVCGMIHSGNAPETCDSCGATTFTQQAEIHREMHNRW